MKLLDDATRAQLTSQITLHEGQVLKVYDDATGKPVVKGSTLQGHPTIGVGRNLADRGISKAVSDQLLAEDIAVVEQELARALPWISQLDQVRRAVLVEMGFNLGVPRLLGFRKTLALVQLGRYQEASVEMLNSTWANQVGKRARTLSTQLRTGILS